MKTLSYTDKISLFENRKYHCQVPPVITTQWSAESWIRWIDATGSWLTEEKEKEIIKDAVQTNTHKHVPSL